MFPERSVLSELIDSMPIAAVFVGMVAMILIASEVGFRVGQFHHLKRQDKEAPGSIGPMVAGLLSMLAFVLAFVFSMANAQYDVRRQNVLSEANAIGTASLRADLIDEPHGTEIKRLLRDYATVRLKAAQGGDLKAALARSLDIQRLLWAQVVQSAAENPGVMTSTMAQSVIAVIDLHEKRKTDSLHSRIPARVWLGLVAITFLAMLTLGMQVGLHGKRRLVAVTPLSMAFAVLVTLVVDLDRPQAGFITVSQEAMIDLQESLAP